MEKRNNTSWNNILKVIVSEIPKSNNIIFDGSQYEFRYIANSDTRMGYMIIWNPITKKAVQISRVKVPLNIDFIDIENESELSKHIPDNLEFMSM